MSISRRTTLATGGVLVALLLGLFIVVRSVMLAGFAEVEDRTTKLNVERASQAIDLASETLSVKLSDWSTWDDTYRFVADHNDAYVESNLTAKGLEELRLHAMLFLNTAGTLVHAVTLTEDGISPEPPSGMMEAIHALPPQGDEDRHGLLIVGSDLFLVAARPILTSEGEGPTHGTLLFIERFDEERIASLRDRLRLKLDVEPSLAASTLASASTDVAITRIDDEFLRGETTLLDLAGHPAIHLRVVLPRYVHQQALQTARLIALTLVCAGILSLVITAAVLRWLLLGRLARLHNEVQSIGHSIGGAAEMSAAASDPLVHMNRRVSVHGSDELSTLANTVNGLLDRVANAQSALASAKAAAERANQAKSDFLANMSHEVRTPLTAILGFADLVGEQLGSDRSVSEHLETIRRNGRHLLAVINDILDLSKIEAGQMTIERLHCSPLLITHEVSELLADRAKQRGLSLTVSIDGRVPSIISSDPLRLRQILLNLAGNAIKFTERGGVELRMRFDESARQLIVDVIDSGAGLSPDKAKRLFVAFSQADLSVARTHGGTGLGLTISRRLAQLLGGNVELHATGPTGSTFRVRVGAGELPESVEFLTGIVEPGVRKLVEPVSTPNASEPGPSGASAPPLAGRRLLLAEDGPDNQRLISFVLRRAGAHVDIVGDGQRAVETALAAMRRGEPYDLLLLDIQMPLMDGFAAAKALRTARLTTPILALTAHAMEGDRLACIEAGCDEYASKPIDRVELIDACRRLSAPEQRRAA